MPPPFQLLASHPALDFVNTLDNRFVDSGPSELLPRYADLLAFVEQTALVSTRAVNGLTDRADSPRARKVLAQAHTLREALAAVVYASAATADSMSVLETACKAAQQHQELEWKRNGTTDGSAWQAGWKWGRSETELELPVWALAKSAMELLTSPVVQHVRTCKSDTCRWVFLDTSKNHSRRWCDMKICGNRMKARRFQARQ
ncbi:MAG: CGNR zinc finger domain-containing protein [Proteobacteria bacterium]|nr:CGNR zinc finger domain-containing protein [Pseudomonadota bacterium]